MKKILISAFKPFNNLNNNYSMEVLNYIESEDYLIDKVVIDVVYDECFKEIEKNNLDEYDLIISLGEARMRQELTIESQAKNISSCSLKDNSGIIKKLEKIDDNISDFLQTNLNLEILKKYAKISNDAGTFVCNNLYFHLLKYNNNKCLFIHIPECFDNVDNYKKYAENIVSIIKVLILDKISEKIVNKYLNAFEELAK